MRAVAFEDLLGRRLNETEQKHSPGRMYVKGPMKTPIPPSTASVIGTRHPSEDGIDEARRLVRTLVENDICVVSGLAAGIDAVAHRTAIDVGGSTVAVLGTPLDRTYPASNHSLQQEIMKDHLAVSQFPTGRPITKANFVIRNRTMALLSCASIIVEAGEKSGTVHHGWETIRLGRPLFVCGPAARRNPQWLDEMRPYGATILEDYDDILEAISTNVDTMNVFNRL